MNNIFNSMICLQKDLLHLFLQPILFGKHYISAITKYSPGFSVQFQVD